MQLYISNIILDFIIGLIEKIQKLIFNSQYRGKDANFREYFE